MSKKTVLLLSLVLLAAVSNADVKTHMDEMLGYIFDLKPYITSPEKFQDPNNAPFINTTLQKMAALSDKIQHEDKIKNSAREVPAMALSHQLKEAQEVFNTGNKSYSLWMVRSNLSNCVACHTQLPAKSTSFGEHGKKKNYVNSFQEAEFLYIVRNFDKALEYYDQTFNNFPGNNISIDNLDISVFRKVYYYTRVKRDLKKLAESLQTNLKNKKLPAATAQLLAAYVSAAKNIGKDNTPSFQSDQDLQTYAEKTLAKELAGDISYNDANKNLRNLQLSGYLYEYLDKNPKSELKPYIYYWLSFCESRWERGLQDSLPESYLRKCITEFPNSPIAAKCYKEYEDLMVFGYTGSSGTHIPPDVTLELKNMREKMGKSK